MKRPLALITGGTSGIGLGAAKRLIANWDLALAFASNEAQAQSALQELRSLRPEARLQTFKKKLKDHESAQELYGEVVAHFQESPAALINCAGRLHDGLFLRADFAQYRHIIDEHLVATMALTQLCLKSMYNAKSGRIVNLSSISSFYAKRGQSNYAAAKAGLEAFTKTLALEVAHRGVTVNAVAPGLIETPMTTELIAKFESGQTSIRERIPAGRVGKAEEVGALIAFLVSPDAAYINGTVIVIDGGRSLGDPAS